ncbi:RDD family protein [Frigoriflavimonas asaccharolytica]|uniref:Putative RDD family membrane protein YckC n=1 Tax=Frigoriflavimonas asaccharolytica TaxID=2735899 RepID=A0A8J8G807_9FLAO|nr:RDD family protein [Frigoriflavimonas asaccharolytica]NRS92966.1 putative RDD family membrane protein YckC [Frigoriflavimonas asaccharolytica]
MAKYLKIVKDNKASQGTRFVNLLIDRVAFMSLFFFLGLFAGILSSFFGIDLFMDLLDSFENVNSFLDIIITSSILIVYYFVFEYFSKGRTLGKYVTGTIVVKIDGTAPTTYDIFLRSIIRLVPFNALSFLGENGWHDSWSETRVVVKKKFEEALKSQHDLNSLGNQSSQDIAIPNKPTIDLRKF